MPSPKHTRSLHELFEQRVFFVPNYQRGYSWDRSNVNDLLSDLDNLSGKKYHYTGTVVLHEQPDEHSVDDVYDSSGELLRRSAIVDGQQRLTTLVMLLNSIRRELERLGVSRNMTSKIQTKFVATERRNGQPLYRLELNLGTSPFFHDNILSDNPSGQPPKISSERRLQDARDTIEKHLKAKFAEDPDRTRVVLEEMYVKVSNSLRFSLYEVEEAADVGVIFEVMNDRGKPLSELEKVKNYLLYASTVLFSGDNELESRVKEAWTTVLTLLMSAELETSSDENALLRAHWVTAYDHQPRGWGGAKAVKGRLDVRAPDRDPTRVLNDLMTYAKSLAETAIPFCDAHAPSRSAAFRFERPWESKKEQIVEWSEKLHRMDTLAIFVPILIAVRRRYPSDVDKYLRLLHLCERYAFRVFALRESRTDAGQGTLFKTAYQLTKREIGYEDAVTAIRTESAKRCGDKEFSDAWDRHIEDASWYEWRAIKYLLYEYEIFLAGQSKARPRLSWQDLILKGTVEHVLPQTPRSSYWIERFDEEERQQYLNDLGNLALTLGNAELGNKSFPQKKGSPREKNYCYAKSLSCVERDLTRWDEWTPETIKQRRKKMLEWARDRWS